MDEFRIIGEIFAPLATAHFAFGLTDDAAVIPPRPGFDLVVTTDAIAESIHDASGHTAQASTEIGSVEQAVARGAAAVGDITTWTAKLSSHADDLETKVATFFNRVRAA